MASSPVTSLHINSDLLNQVSEVFEKLGLTISTAVGVLLGTVPRVGTAPVSMRAHDKKQFDADGEAQRVCANALAKTNVFGRWSG